MQLPIGLAIVRGSGVLLVGIGLMVVVFASREVDPWPRAKVGSAIWAAACSFLSMSARPRNDTRFPRRVRSPIFLGSG